MLDIIRSKAQSWGVKLAFGVIIIVFVFWGVGGLTGGPTAEVLSVNGEPITAQAFQRQLELVERNVTAQYPDITPEQRKALKIRQSVVQQLVLETILTQEAKRTGVVISPVELRKRIESYPLFQNAQGKFDPQIYKQTIDAQRDSLGRFETQVASQMLMEKLQQEVTAGSYVTEPQVRELFMYDGERRILEYVLFPLTDYADKAVLESGAVKAWYDANQAQYRVPATADVDYLLVGANTLAPSFPVDDAAVKTYYDQHAAQYTQPEKIRARHIIILAPESTPGADAAKDATAKKAEETILSLEKRLKAGEDFATLATEFSQDGTAAQGGDLGWFAREQMVPPFADAAFALKPGQISGPVRTQFGYHLIKMEEHEAAGQVPMAEVNDEIRHQLGAEQAAGKLQDVLDQILLAVIGGKDLAEVAAAHKLTVENTGPLDASALAQRVGIKENDAKTLLAAKPGATMDTPFVTKTGYIVARVKDVKPESVKSFDTVSADIEKRLKEQKTRQMAMDAATAARTAMTGQTLPAEQAAKIAKSQPIARDGNLADLGINAGLGTAAFNADPGQWLPVAYALDGGAALVRVAELVPPTEESWEKVAKPLTEALVNAKREQMYRTFVNLLQSQASIKVLNEKIFEE